MLMCLVSTLSVWADVQAVLPWGADVPWDMKYVMQPSDSYSEPADDGTGKSWTQLGYDDSAWQTLTGPMANGEGNQKIYYFKNFTWEGENNIFNLRRTFTLTEVNASGYTFATQHDDGIMVYINGNKVYDREGHTNFDILTTHIDASKFQTGENQIAIYFNAGSFSWNYLDYALFVGNNYNNGKYDGLDINGLRYWLNDDGETAYVVGINEGVETATIQSSISFKDKDYRVTTIAARAFAESAVTTVRIPSTITTIGADAFYNCNIDKVYITDLEAWCKIDFLNGWGGSSNPLNSGDGKLYLNNTRVTSLVIPETITEIKKFAFNGCKFSYLTIPNTVTSIGEGAFFDCSTLRTASLSNPEGSSALTSIGVRAFRGCSAMNSINFTQYPTVIGEEAFSQCNSLTSIQLNDNLTSIQPYTFSECSSLTTINIPNSVTSIGEDGFSGCENLSIDLILPEGLTTVGNRGFSGLGKVKMLSLPNSLTTVGAEAFKGLQSIKTLYIPSGLTSIGEQAFVGLSNAVSIVVSGDNPKYDSRNNCNAIIKTETGQLLAGCRNTIIPDGVTSLERAALAWMPFTIFVVPNTVEEIKEGAFSWCVDVKTIVLGSGITDIGQAIHYHYCPNDVYCYAIEVPATNGNAFYWGGGSSGGTLHVPEESIDEYRKTAPWSEFSTIVAITGEEEFPVDLFLDESVDNSTKLAQYNGKKANVHLDRTLNTGGWNTFAVPFEVADLDGTALGGATLKELTSSSVNGGTLSMTFGDASSVDAGKPYLVKVSEKQESLIFSNVTVNADPNPAVTDYVDFVPTFGKKLLTGPSGDEDNEKAVLYVGASNKLYTPTVVNDEENENSYLKGFRAFFQLHDGASEARNFIMNLDEENVTGVIDINSKNNAQWTDDVYYTLDGRRVGKKPSKKGLYILNGQKVCF